MVNEAACRRCRAWCSSVPGKSLNNSASAFAFFAVQQKQEKRENL